MPPNNARSVAVPIVPKRVGEIEIEVTSILQVNIGGSYLNSAGDAVRRKLLIEVGISSMNSGFPVLSIVT